MYLDTSITHQPHLARENDGSFPSREGNSIFLHFHMQILVTCMPMGHVKSA